MAKLSSEELSGRINALDIPEDTKISLMEDITDSVDTSDAIEERDKTIEKLNAKYNDLEEKYKSRFLSRDDAIAEDKKDTSASSELKEEEIIDVKEI